MNSGAPRYVPKFPLEIVVVTERSVNITDADGYDIAHDIEPEHAEAIVRACNSYDALVAALTPRQWSREMSDAWHRAIPDVEAAFAAIRELAFKRGRGEP